MFLKKNENHKLSIFFSFLVPEMSHFFENGSRHGDVNKKAIQIWKLAGVFNAIQVEIWNLSVTGKDTYKFMIALLLKESVTFKILK